ncbi:hypothetical protein CF326_g3129 [Tilletia indica]|nr:hypothetical protein CF326_g3129 [Tilletia indica]
MVDSADTTFQAAVHDEHDQEECADQGADKGKKRARVEGRVTRSRSRAASEAPGPSTGVTVGGDLRISSHNHNHHFSLSVEEDPEPLADDIVKAALGLKKRTAELKRRRGGLDKTLKTSQAALENKVKMSAAKDKRIAELQKALESKDKEVEDFKTELVSKETLLTQLLEHLQKEHEQ